jgi:two-component system NtrC family response regulator
MVLGETVIEERHLPVEVRAGGLSPRTGTLKRAEEATVREALAAAKGNKAMAARILGIDRNTLYAKLKRLRREP